MEVNIVRYVSPLVAISNALGDIGYAHLMQTHEPHMVRWAREAQDLISKKRTYTLDTDVEYEVEDNKVFYGEDVGMIGCVSMGGKPLSLIREKGCVGMCTESCKQVCCGNEQGYIVDECYFHFEPVLKDGTKIQASVYRMPTGADGYPLVADVCLMAVAEYVKAKVCFLKKDNRYNTCMQQWAGLKKVARAELNKFTQKQLEEIGYLWM